MQISENVNSNHKERKRIHICGLYRFGVAYSSMFKREMETQEEIYFLMLTA